MSAVFAIGTVSVNGYGRRPAMLSDGRVYILDEVSSYCAGRGIALPPATSVLELLERWDDTVEACAALSAEIEAGHLAKFARRESEIRIHAPHEPRQVFCTGANYHRHVVDIIVDRFGEKKMREDGLTKDELRQWAEDLMTKRAETGQPYIFTRIASAYAGPFDDLVIPAFSQEPDWEAELAVVFKRGGHNIPRDEALSHVAGYMVVNDITSRDQIYTADPAELGADWFHAKNSPGFFPMGPWIVPARFVADPHNLRITLKLNGEIMQDEPTSDMIFDIPTQIAVLSKYARIIAGDVLATGSPAGNGTHYNRYLKPGDVVEASVEGLGTQSVRCVAAD